MYIQIKTSRLHGRDMSIIIMVVSVVRSCYSFKYHDSIRHISTEKVPFERLETSCQRQRCEYGQNRTEKEKGDVPESLSCDLKS